MRYVVRPVLLHSKAFYSFNKGAYLIVDPDDLAWIEVWRQMACHYGETEIVLDLYAVFVCFCHFTKRWNING